MPDDEKHGVVVGKGQWPAVRHACVVSDDVGTSALVQSFTRLPLLPLEHKMSVKKGKRLNNYKPCGKCRTGLDWIQLTQIDGSPARPDEGKRPDTESHSLSRGRMVLAGALREANEPRAASSASGPRYRPGSSAAGFTISHRRERSSAVG